MKSKTYQTFYATGVSRQTKRTEHFILRASSQDEALQQVESEDSHSDITFHSDRTYSND